MLAKFIQETDAGFTTTEFPIERLRAGMEERGFGFTGLNSNPRQRQELQGQPKFKGVVGPMWGGDHLRYECPKAYASLSM